MTKVQAHTALLNGTLALRPVADFYESNKIISLNDPLEVDTASGKFEALVLTNASPTLTFAQLKNSEELQVQAIRSRAAYSQYAGNSGAASLGRSLAHAASRATGDMQNLLEALDWSSRDGHEVSRALDTLGAEAYDASARASLAQQSEFNLLILRRMLGNESTRRTLAMRGTTHEDQPDAENWQFWATPYGSGAWQGSHGGVSSWKSSGIGLIVGADRYFESGLMLGAHAALAARRTHVAGNHEAQADTQSAFIGLQGMLAPDSWDGFWFAAQGRLGIESGEMDREVSFNGYIRNNESRWSGFSGSALLGGGKDWSWKIGDGHLNAGPLAWMEYSFLHRPGIEEQSGQASRLDVDETVYQSLLFSRRASWPEHHVRKRHKPWRGPSGCLAPRDPGCHLPHRSILQGIRQLQLCHGNRSAWQGLHACTIKPTLHPPLELLRAAGAGRRVLPHGLHCHERRPAARLGFLEEFHKCTGGLVEKNRLLVAF